MTISDAQRIATKRDVDLWRERIDPQTAREEALGVLSAEVDRLIAERDMAMRSLDEWASQAGRMQAERDEALADLAAMRLRAWTARGDSR